MHDQPSKRKYNDKHLGATPVRKKRGKNERPSTLPLEVSQQFNHVSLLPRCSPVTRHRTGNVARRSTLKETKEPTSSTFTSPIQGSSPVTPVKDFSPKSPLISPFSSGHKVLHQQLSLNSMSTPKSTKLDMLTSQKNFNQLNDSDLDDFNPDTASNITENSVKFMSDDSALENFDLDKVVNEKTSNSWDNADGSFPEDIELLEETSDLVDRTRQIHEKLKNSTKSHFSNFGNQERIETSCLSRALLLGCSPVTRHGTGNIILNGTKMPSFSTFTSPVRPSSPVTPVKDFNHKSLSNSPFITGHEVLHQQLSLNSMSTPKSTKLDMLTSLKNVDQLNDSDLDNFNPDTASNVTENSVKFMSDDSALENFDLDKVVKEKTSNSWDNADGSFPEDIELLEETSALADRSRQIHEKLGKTNEKHELLVKSMMSEDQYDPEGKAVDENEIDGRYCLRQIQSSSPDSKKLNTSNLDNQERMETSCLRKALNENENNFNQCDVQNITLALSQDDANSWDTTPSTPKGADSSISPPLKSRDSGLGVSFDSKDNNATCDKSFSKSLTTPTPKGLTSKLMVSKNITEQLKANNGEKCAVRQEKSNVLKISEEFFGLPYKVKLLISKYKGIPDLYLWQKECLNLEAIKKRKNLIYALPTSGGKTLVAEILMFREMLIHEKNVIFILPYVSIVQEKVRALSPFGVELNFVVEEYAGGKGVFPPVKRRRKRIIYVATIEKASGLVNNLYETGRLEEEIGLIVIDELHLIGEPRGAILEATLTKIMYANLQIHIVGMSATIGNLRQLAHFLNAEVFTHNFRPVELTEYVKCESQVYSITSDIEGKKLTPLRQVKLQPNDPDFVAGLVREVIPDHSCLVFCASKKNCENVALLICRTLNQSFQEPKKDVRNALLRALAEEGNGDICKILKQTIPFGVAYHHSGLTIAERKLLEEAFCSNTICCICCTSTLAAGVNLPAKRVIIRSPYVGNKFIMLSQYKQMIGRAGRAGFNEDGESFLLCQKNDVLKIMTLLNSKINSCDSQLKETNAFPSLILSAVGLGLASSPDDIKLFFNNTLFHAQNGLDADFDGLLEKSIKDLLDVGALQTKKHGDKRIYQLSDLGRGAVKANITIDDAKVLYADLKIALKCVSLSNYLHRLYLITPYSMACQIPINKDIYFNVYMSLDAEELNVAKIIGIDDGCIMKFMSGRKSTNNISHIMHRFYLTLILHKLWMNRNVWEVGSLFNIPRGLVHSLLTSAASFNSSVIRFCEELTQFSSIAVLLKEMSERLVHCCSAELLPLMELPSVKLGRAKQLLRAGYKNLQLIARSEVNSMVRAIDHLPKRVACQIIAAAKLLLLAKAELLQEEAEQVLEGLEGMKLY